MQKNIYIGLNDNYHDPAICILNEQGEVLFCESTERFLQYKRGLGCPPDLDVYIETILAKYIDYNGQKIIIASSWSKKWHFYAKLFNVIGSFNYHSKSIFSRILKAKKVHPSFHQNALRAAAALNQSGVGIFNVFNKWNKNSVVVRAFYNHHLCHMSNAVNSSTLSQGMGLVIDGGGEFTAISFYSIKNNKISLIKNIKSNFSLGTLYSLITGAIGYSRLKGEEWKVMGLAAYGKINHHLLRYLETIFIHKKKKFTTKSVVLGKYEAEIKQLINTNNIVKEDVAFTGQFLFTKFLKELLLLGKDLIPNELNLFISGGSALNSLSIGTIAELNWFKNIIVPNAPADDGNAIGAAYLAFQSNNKQGFDSVATRSPYTGTAITNLAIENYVTQSGLPFKKLAHPEKTAANLLHQNKIIGWIQGKAEFGPRALGNRSILANPTFKENKNRINEVVKFRESFRPFAPSILHEFGNIYFKNYSFTPYMEKTLTYQDDVLAKVSAVVHKNNTGRLQSVTKEMNIKYYHLILEFYKLTGVPLVINTSYNVMGKPIAHSINDVMAVFFNSKIDAVIINNYYINKNDIK